MLDVARNFQPKDEVLKVIDLLALYKLNRLHFHLNDDEGWRLEIPGLPELVETGGKRGHGLTEENQLLPAYGSGPDRLGIQRFLPARAVFLNPVSSQPDVLSRTYFKQDFSAFLHATGREIRRLDSYSGGYSYRIPTPGARAIDGAVHANTDLPGFTIRYTTNGEEPNARSNVYRAPLKDRKRIALRTFSQTGRGGLTVWVDNR